MNPVDYLLIGNMTADLLADGSYIAGGTVSYAAPVAQAFGLRVGIVTRTRPGEPLLDTLRPYAALHVVDSAETTIFENIYTPQGRIQYVRGVADDITPAEIPQAWQGALMVHLAPIAREAAHVGILDLFPQATILFTPQGWLRQWDASGRVAYREWHDEAMIRRADVIVLSEEDIAQHPQAEDILRPMAQRLVVTRSDRGGTYYINGERFEYEAVPAQVLEPTGAGDVFAVSLLCAYHLSNDFHRAIRVAAVLAADSLSRAGMDSAPSLETVKAALAAYDIV
ncbi:MAG TPA: PfkB family carbohydrate kinase [Aggregatilineales bacterium]|nr:PfkB family carbohydrate kinase [Aggregatilineales bacterium]